jgi:NADPH:quinone reductase-like Zn-dependent oxidoreductase
MTAFRLVGWQQPAEFQEVPVPTPGPGEALVEVAAVGLCHTDVHFLHAPAGAFPYRLPFTLGHEIAGRVVAVGASVADLAVGAAVAVAAGPAVGVVSRVFAATTTCAWPARPGAGGAKMGASRDTSRYRPAKRFPWHRWTRLSRHRWPTLV